MLKKIITVLMILSCLGMGSYLIVQYKNEDRNGPAISFSQENVMFDANTDDESILLDDAEAYDSVDGDVSDSLRIESIYQSNETEAIVVYVARDNNNNITKVKRIIEYTPLETNEEETETETENVTTKKKTNK